jgi:hypothetical protein
MNAFVDRAAEGVQKSQDEGCTAAASTNNESAVPNESAIDERGAQ